MILRGRFVVLEPLTLDHVDALWAIAAGDRASFRYTFVPEGREAVAAYVQQAVAEEGAAYAIRQGEAIVGTTRLTKVERWDWPGRAQRPNPDAGELGWTWLHPAVQRTAVNTESKRLLLGLAFDAWKMQRVTLLTDARNERSRQAIVRLGGNADGVLRAHFPAPDGTLSDSAVYSIVRAEWPAIRERLDRRLQGGDR